VAGCGRPQQKVDVRPGINRSEEMSDTQDPSCTNESCPAIAFSLVDGSERDLKSAEVSGERQQPVRWPIYANSDGVSGRIKIVIREAPSWLKSSPGERPGSIVLTGNPSGAQPQGLLTILARDMTRCQVLENKSKDCEDPRVPFQSYDKTFTIKFSIK
jgi:hypothetical protein